MHYILLLRSNIILLFRPYTIKSVIPLFPSFPLFSNFFLRNQNFKIDFSKGEMAETEESNIFCIGDKYFIYVCALVEYIWGNVILFRCMSNCFDACRIVSSCFVVSRLLMDCI